MDGRPTMADPDLADLAELAPVGADPVEVNPLAALLAEPSPRLVARVSDALREVIGDLARARRRIQQLEQVEARVTTQRDDAAGLLAKLRMLHREDWEADGSHRVGTGRCAGCKRKWPCRSERIMSREES